MVDRASVVETVQIGLEATPGTDVPASHLVTSFDVMMKQPAQADMFRPDGHKFVRVAELNQEWTAFDLRGKPTYTEICWPLAMLYGNPTPTASGTGAKTRVYTMADGVLGTPKTATIEKGGTVRAQQMTYALLTGLGFTISRSAGLEMSGSGIGQLFTDGITKTAGATETPLVPIIGKHFDLYIDSTAAGLGTTKMLRAFRIEPSIGDAYGPLWAINSALPSFAAHIDLAPTTALKIMLEADAAGMAYLTQFRAGTTIFVRAEAVGAEFEAGIPYKFTYDMALKVKSMEPDGDEAGVKVVTWETEFTHDATWDNSHEITVVNDVATVA